MKPISARTTGQKLLPWLALGLFAVLPVGAARAAADAAFAAALAALQQERAVVGGITSMDKVIAQNTVFFSRFDLAALTPREIAAIVRVNAFAYGDVGKAKAKSAAERLEPLAAAPDADGALATALLVMISGPAGKGPQRAGWEAATLHHPAFSNLLQGEFGDLALDVACRTAPRDENARAFFLGLAGKLDATKSTAAAGQLSSYWDRVVGILPEGERRQAIRQQLVDYLAGALARQPDATADARRHEVIAAQLARLNGAEARGQFYGRPAPELHFLWSSRAGWQSLADLRGRVVVLDFWATWCGPCVAAFPEVAHLVERYRGLDVEIVGLTSLQGTVSGLEAKAIDCRGDPAKELRLMADYIKARNLTWPIVFSREPVLNPDYGVNGIPTTVVIAPDGTVRYKAVGYSGAKLVGAIDAILSEFKLRAPAPAVAK
jgi:thiol-disulfide isomerase/thioredoxin